LKPFNSLTPELPIIFKISFSPSPFGVNALGISKLNTGGAVMSARAVAIVDAKT
jgi:hypothetical protein